MKCTVFDRAGYRITQREYTDEGFLKVPGRVARTGIQEYLARALGLDGDPMRIVRVYRPEEEVFKPESLDSYDASDVTNNHPSTLVTAETYKGVAVGVVRGSGRRDGDFVVCDLNVKDKATIDDINSGKCELSAGYTAIYDPTPGVTEDGKAYDYIQRDIKINHVAIVERARAGANARVFDHTPESNMSHKVTLDSGSSVEVSDAATAVALSDAFERLNKKVTDAEARADKAQASADSLNEKLEEARKASSDEAVKARVEAVSATHAMARKVAGDSFTCDSLDVTEIKRAALTVARPKVEWPSKSAAYVEAAFDAEMEKESDEEEEEGEVKVTIKDKKKSTDAASVLLAQLAQLAKDGATTVKTADAAPSPYQREKARLANAHKAVHAQKGA